ncbi:uncharacterized protein [Arachis hypogaea]|uniref:uncharacterized protein n=1 Tax=Arachis hypogaea TaxID=3818 RepID=UPI003B2217D1
MSHHLAVKTAVKPVAQMRRKMSQERAEEVARQTASLLEAGFIRELDYSTWLSNVVLIPMYQPNEEKIAFITPGGTYCYKVMPFGLKNAGATYQRLMNKIFSDLTGKTVEVYVDDILQNCQYSGKEVGSTRLEVCSDLQVVTSHIKGTYQARDPLLQKYLEKVKKLSEQFEEVMVQHVPRERNTRADLLSKLASTKPGTGNRSLIQGLIKEAAVALHITKEDPSWMNLFTNFLEIGKLPGDEKSAKALRREAAKYAIIQGQLFKKGLSQPLLKCLHPSQTGYVLREVHEGCYGYHIGGKALARKLIRAGYYWPLMMKDSKEFVKKCMKCQENTNFHKALATELNLLTSSRPFSHWGVDLLGPFSVGSGQVKYLIVAIDYYTKWIEAEPLASISSSNCRKFM